MIRNPYAKRSPSSSGGTSRPRPHQVMRQNTTQHRSQFSLPQQPPQGLHRNLIRTNPYSNTSPSTSLSPGKKRPRPVNSADDAGPPFSQKQQQQQPEPVLIMSCAKTSPSQRHLNSSSLPPLANAPRSLSFTGVSLRGTENLTSRAGPSRPHCTQTASTHHHSSRLATKYAVVSRNNSSMSSQMGVTGEASTTEAKSKDKHDPFDDGYDWEATVPMLDKIAGAKSQTQDNAPAAKKSRTSCEPSAVPIRAHNNGQPLSMTAMASAQVIDTQSIRQRLPPAGQKALNASKHYAERGALASLRPPSWNAAGVSATGQPVSKGNPSSPMKPTTHSHATIRNSSPSHRSEPPLPSQLQFVEGTLGPVDDEHRKKLVKNANLSAPLLNNWTLFNHQKRAILKGLLMRRTVLALDMGLGKTLIGCVWAKSFYLTFPCCKTIVVCPVTLMKDWIRTAEKATGLKVQEDCCKAKTKKNPGGCDETTDTYIASWGKVPSEVPAAVDNYVLVVDEAHSMQSMKAARTEKVLKLALAKRCVGVLLLTGTPMKNGKPCNLFPLLKAVKHPFGKHQRAYETHFCAGHEQTYGRCRKPLWVATGASNLAQLRRLVASHVLYLTKEECIRLPPLTRVVKKVPVCSRRQLQYSRALQDLANVYSRSTSNRSEQGNEEVLGAMQKVRCLASFAKIEATVELAKSVLEKEPAVVIFTSFCDVAKSLCKQLSEAGWTGELLTGETPAQKRQGLVDNFQEGLSPVFVSTYGAGGVGLTLTAAATVILLDRPWTPGDVRQAEDRVRRIGTKASSIRSIWMSAFELDKQMDAMIEHKMSTSKAVFSSNAEGKDQDGSVAAGGKLNIDQLIKAVLPPTTGAAGDPLKQTTILQFTQP